jgi:hypothetical protein
MMERAVRLVLERKDTLLKHRRDSYSNGALNWAILKVHAFLELDSNLMI